MKKWQWIFRVMLLVSIFPIMGCCLVPKMIYPAPYLQVSDQPPSPYESKFLDDRFHVWIRKPPNSEAPVVIWCHGNGENLETMRRSRFFKHWSKIEAGLIAVDYPGYGLSPGGPNEKGVVDSVIQAIQEARQRWPSQPLVVAGWSLGSAAALQAIRKEKPEGLILISAFASLKDAGQSHYPNWLVSLLSTFSSDSYDSLNAAKEIDFPTLVIHGKRDRIIPIEQGQKIAAVTASSQHLWLENVGHNDILSSSAVWKAIAEFINEIGPKK